MHSSCLQHWGRQPCRPHPQTPRKQPALKRHRTPAAMSHSEETIKLKLLNINPIWQSCVKLGAKKHLLHDVFDSFTHLALTSGSMVSMLTNLGKSRESSELTKSVRTMLVPSVLPCSKPCCFHELKHNRFDIS